ncbi:MAG TPA: IclR family transcriptional regulator [Casimicrobiaceae bacterium]|nr:IclR family transcriptional regulator [Casimicrobiaceae bacterium]
MSSVAKALLVLECVGLSDRRTLTDIAKDVALPKSTLLRLIHALIARGFLRRTAHGEYAVSLKMWRIGCNALDSGAIRDEVLPLLRRLVERTGETAHYAAYEDGSSVYIEKVDGLHPIRSYTAVGGRSPAYATATGKALLAWRDEAEIAEIGRRAQRFTDATTCGADEVSREAAKTRKLGYAVNRGEWRASVWGIAAPIFNRHAKVIAAVGISGPRERVESNIEPFSDAVCETAKKLSTALAPLDPALALRRES